MNNRTKVLSAVAVLSFLILIMYFIVIPLYDYFFSPSDYLAYSDEITSEDKFCEVNEDCSIVNLGCCYVYGKYSEHNLVAVNESGKKKINEWKHDNCVACMTQNDQLMYDDVITKQFCEQNHCQIKHLSCTSVCVENGEQSKGLEEELTKIGMTIEQAIKSCRC